MWKHRNGSSQFRKRVDFPAITKDSVLLGNIYKKNLMAMIYP